MVPQSFCCFDCIITQLLFCHCEEERQRKRVANSYCRIACKLSGDYLLVLNLIIWAPCPPDREQRYFFKLYALDTELNLPEKAAKQQVEKAMESHILMKTQLMGRYKRLS